MKKQWETPSDLNTWSFADLIGVRSVLRMMHRWEEAAVVTTELSRRGFNA
jgi:hypothetical protein